MPVACWSCGDEAWTMVRDRPGDAPRPTCEVCTVSRMAFGLMLCCTCGRRVSVVMHGKSHWCRPEDGKSCYEMTSPPELQPRRRASDEERRHGAGMVNPRRR